MQFAHLRLAEPILRAVAAEGYSVATPVQAQSIPHVLAGRDVLGCAQTGTGKTAAFALPILHRLSAAARPAGTQPRVRCLVLCPTRELAAQIGDSFRAYGKNLSLRHAVIFGGVKENPQISALRHGLDILIATPGRLLDLAARGHADLRAVEVLVLDEADRMLDMGFIHDIRKIVARIPQRRQTLLFSATMPPDVRRLTDTLLRDPVSIQVAAESATADGVAESVYFVEKRNKPALLAHLVDHLPMSRAIVFTRTKHGADRVVRHLHTSGIRAEAIHGNKSQNTRERALGGFRSGKTPVLVATDIASRGIDVDGITHVVNYDLSHEPETYVHRIGRTARAGATGSAVSLCDREEVPHLRAIEKLIRRHIPVCTDHPTYAAHVPGTIPEHGDRARRSSPQRKPHAAQSSGNSQPRSAGPNRSAHATHAPARDARQHAPVTQASRPGGGVARQGGAGQGHPTHSNAPSRHGVWRPQRPARRRNG